MNIKSTAEKLQALINSQSRSPTLEAIEAVLREGEEWFDLTEERAATRRAHHRQQRRRRA